MAGSIALNLFAYQNGAQFIRTHDVLETNAQINHPGFIAHMDPPTPSIAIAAGMMQIATNQNLLHPDVAPKARQIEQRVVDWLASSFHMNGGHFVPGSTIANLTALWAARETRDITTIIASNKSHLSVKKAANLLNLNYIECKTNEKDEMISFLSRKHHRVKEQTILRHFFAWVTGLKAMDLA